MWLAPARAALPGANGQIAFERGGTVWLANPDGTGAHATTAVGTLDPAVSPGGDRIAFSKAGDVWTMNADGSGQRDITAALGSTDRQPTWSPDGTRIAFSRGQAGQPYRIWMVGADGSNPVQLTGQSGGDFSPAWAPDGNRIAYVRANNSTDIYTVDPAQPLAEVPYVGPDAISDDMPNWSPDGGSIAFASTRVSRDRNVFVQIGAAGTPVAVTSDPALDEDPAFSPDGTRIAFTSNRGGTRRVWTVGSTGVEQAPAVVTGTDSGDQPDWGVARAAAPVIGRTLEAAPVKGRVLVAVPSSSAARARGKLTFVPLTKGQELPMGTQFDTTRGTVHLTFAASRTGSSLQSGNFNGGRFQTRQSRRNPLTELRLTGQLKCKTSAKASAARRKRSRSLFANAHGRFRTRGRHSTATVRGTQWLTKDTCAGTLTVVRRGTVVVRDLRKHKTVRVKAGHRYLARARGLSK